MAFKLYSPDEPEGLSLIKWMNKNWRKNEKND